MDIGKLEEGEYQDNNKDIIPENVINVGYDDDDGKIMKDDFSPVKNNEDLNEASHSEDVKSDVATRLLDDVKVNMDAKTEDTSTDVHYNSDDWDLESKNQDSEVDGIIKDIEEIVYNEEEDIPKEAKNSANIVSEGKIEMMK